MPEHVVAIMLVALGGALGSVARYGVAVASKAWLGGAFPWGTLAVNLVGAFAMGVLMIAVGRFEGRAGERLLLLLGTGVLGGLTTFSTFAFEVHALTNGALDAAAQRTGWIYLAASIVGGLVAVACGARAGAMWAATN